ncbi:MAG: hypothetical protein AMQ22_01268 [Candidatus Methanofastidiosum methylothiophilum]|jgi:hypothetical protein|uniref:Uncharacterized protein n=1 Tax=Candidatus Methanofastidiosum methylothiophilum TaxID=1705564 RepID=A0A150J2W0_9EURY|nr:MAG: hypothetical protein AMQ22_01268 [Candidatus Methanofastidiosum methylthiophilus]
MSFPNLIEVKDVKKIFPDLESNLNTPIKNYIPTATWDTYQDAEVKEVPTDEAKLNNLKMACSYKVLMWLEGSGKIESSSNEITSMKDAGFSVTFKQAVSSKKQPKSYSEWYAYYLNRLKSRPPVGGKSRRGWR